MYGSPNIFSNAMPFRMSAVFIPFGSRESAAGVVAQSHALPRKLFSSFGADCFGALDANQSPPPCRKTSAFCSVGFGAFCENQSLVCRPPPLIFPPLSRPFVCSAQPLTDQPL